MRLQINKLTNLGLIGSIVVGGLVACNSGDQNASDRQPTIDSAAVNSNVAPANNNGKDTSARKTGMTAKRRKTSAMLPKNTGDKMVMDNGGVYSNVEVMPEFPGGQSGLDDYVNNHIDYPQQAIDNSTSGTVRVSFVVDENGKVTKARLLGNQQLGNGLDEEAIKVVDNMPTWKPGKVKGKNVKTRLELPIAFQVED